MLAATGVSKSHGAHVVLANVDLVVPPHARIGDRRAERRRQVDAPAPARRASTRRTAAPSRATPGAAVGYLPQERDARAGRVAARVSRAANRRRRGRSGAWTSSRRGSARARARAGVHRGARRVPCPRRRRPRGARGADARRRSGSASSSTARCRPLSGGEAARAALASILLSRFDVLLLDEPTNDLDFAGLARLERFLDALRRSGGVVSHDRAFLDRTVDARRRARRVDARRDRVRGRLERVRGRAAAAARPPLRALGGLRRRAGSHRGAGAADAAMGGAGLRPGAQEEEVEGRRRRRSRRSSRRSRPSRSRTSRGSSSSASRRRRAAATSSSGSTQRSSSAARSGSGPSTSRSRWGDRARARRRERQRQDDAPRRAARAAAARGRDALGRARRRARRARAAPRRRSPATSRSLDGFVRASGLPAEEARTLLAKFELGADDVLRRGRSLSPGERTRAVLALLSARGVNCLVLDEPTNHLDVEAIEELERALARLRGNRAARDARPALPRALRRHPYDRAVVATASILTIGNELVSGDVPNTNAVVAREAARAARRRDAPDRGRARRDRDDRRVHPPRGAARRLPARDRRPRRHARRSDARGDRAHVRRPAGGGRRARGGSAGALHARPRVRGAVGAAAARRRPLANPLGGAPGFVLENVYVMPGLPSEMEAMFDSIAEELRARQRRSARGGGHTARARA